MTARKEKVYKPNKRKEKRKENNIQTASQANVHQDIRGNVRWAGRRNGPNDGIVDRDTFTS